MKIFVLSNNYFKLQSLFHYNFFYFLEKILAKEKHSMKS